MYFLPFVPNTRLTHTLPGTVLFCLPAGLLALAVYHKVVERPLFTLLPAQIRKKVDAPGKFSFSPGSRFVKIAASILLGAFTHVVWDSFTHRYGEGVLLFPFLSNSVSVLGKPIFLYKLLQHLSSVLGLLLVGFWFSRRPTKLGFIKPSTSGDAPSRSGFWLALMFAASFLAGVFYGSAWLEPQGVKGFVVQTVVGSVGCFVGILLAYSLVWHLYSRRRTGYSRQRSPLLTKTERPCKPRKT